MITSSDYSQPNVILIITCNGFGLMVCKQKYLSDCCFKKKRFVVIFTIKRNDDVSTSLVLGVKTEVNLIAYLSFIVIYYPIT